jgi:hypothetical protein
MVLHEVITHEVRLFEEIFPASHGVRQTISSLLNKRLHGSGKGILGARVFWAQSERINISNR